MRSKSDQEAALIDKINHTLLSSHERISAQILIQTYSLGKIKNGQNLSTSRHSSIRI